MYGVQLLYSYIYVHQAYMYLIAFLDHQIS